MSSNLVSFGANFNKWGVPFSFDIDDEGWCFRIGCGFVCVDFIEWADEEALEEEAAESGSASAS